VVEDVAETEPLRLAGLCGSSASLSCGTEDEALGWLALGERLGQRAGTSGRSWGVSSGHCRAAVIAEVSAVASVGSVEVNLDTKPVRITGEHLDKAALREAIHQAGYEVKGGE
jgi:copper chaperone CopZ